MKGGACWDEYTCIASPLTNSSTYFQTAHDSQAYYFNNVSGILDDQNMNNPYRGYTKIFIPSCTGDLHWGSRDKQYNIKFSGQDISWEIKHRGFDNFLSTLYFLQNNSFIDFESVEDLSVVGHSAGAYGILLALPYLVHLMPYSQVTMISDSAVGAITSYIFKTAAWNPGHEETTSWGVEPNLPKWVGIDEALFDSFASDPSLGVSKIISKYCNMWDTQMNAAMITPNMDLVQVFYYKLMLSYENSEVTDVDAAIGWYNRMVSGLKELEGISNYRSYVSDGTYHGLLLSDRYYSVVTNEVAINEWNHYAINKITSLWQTEKIPFHWI